MDDHDHTWQTCGVCGTKYTGPVCHGQHPEEERDAKRAEILLRGKDTTDGKPPRPGFEDGPAPAPIEDSTGQHEAYWVLSKEERTKGFVRPVRRSYIHEKCGTVTTMGTALAETYARDPKFYGATFCCHCYGHFPVGEHGEFQWDDGSGEKVGS